MDARIAVRNALEHGLVVPAFNIPYPLAKCLALVGDCIGRKAPINSYKLRKITRSLTFSNEKAKRELGWKPLNVVENFRIN